jgi:nicotinamidase-related amidase
MHTLSGSRKKALLIVDVQPSFLNTRNEYIVQNILNLLSSTKYEIYVETNFHAEKGSLWSAQQNYICPKNETTKTVEELSTRLKDFNVMYVEKETKSVFKGNKDIIFLLRDKNIEEVHIVGLDTNDCVLATAYEAFDFGFITYVIEECCQSSSSQELHEQALSILQKQCMTNKSF